MGGLCSSESAVFGPGNVVEKKIEAAEKTSVLSLRDMNLSRIPDKVFKTLNIKNLDLSQNSLTAIPSDLANLADLKSLNCDKNLLEAGSINIISQLRRLEILSVGYNRLGLAPTTSNKNTSSSFPELPNLRNLKLPHNSFSTIPPQIFAKNLTKLEKIDLSGNQLEFIPSDISNLCSLIEMNLDDNKLSSIPESMGSLTRLKVLSLQNNKIRVDSAKFSTENPQPIPASLFTSSPLIDLKLKGNQLTNTQLNEFDGFPVFLKRITDLNTKKLYGGALVDFNVCGLD